MVPKRWVYQAIEPTAKREADARVARELTKACRERSIHIPYQQILSNTSKALEPEAWDDANRTCTVQVNNDKVRSSQYILDIPKPNGIHKAGLRSEMVPQQRLS